MIIILLLKKKIRNQLIEQFKTKKLVELIILKTYIKINLKNKFIKSFKSPASALILLAKKLDSLLQLYVND